MGDIGRRKAGGYEREVRCLPCSCESGNLTRIMYKLNTVRRKTFSPEIYIYIPEERLIQEAFIIFQYVTLNYELIIL